MTDFDAPVLLRAASAPEAQDLTTFNVRAPDNSLRDEECRPNLLHTAASRAMLADAIGQCLVKKRWRRWFLVVGQHPGDKLYADADRPAMRAGAAR